MAVVETNFKVDQIHAIVTAPSFPTVIAVPTINDCPPASRIFQGRQIILDKMHQFFRTTSGKQLIYVLHGLGGAGKTQIALEYMEESSGSFSDIVFVDASTLDTINTALKNLAVLKGVGDSAQDALTWLQSKHGDWLLFFDNADNPKMNLNEFFPLCNYGNILITSRNPGLRVYGEHSPVSNMEETDAATLLLRSAAKETSEANLQVAAKIVKELYYLPLAIAQAGAFISKSEDLDGYLTLYAENHARLLREKPDQSHDQYGWTVYTTWQISFDQLSKPAARFLQLCSFLHYTGITEDIFSNASKYSAPVELPPKEDLQEPIQFLSHFLGPNGHWSPLNFLDITNEIKAYSLISFDGTTKMFSIHPLVHTWSQSTVPPVDEGLSRLCTRSILGMSISEVPDHELILTSLRLLPHLATLDTSNADKGPDFRAAFWHIYFAAEKFQEAHDVIAKVVEKCKLLLGEQHPATLEVMHQLGLTYRQLGEYEKARGLEVTVLEKQTILLGQDHLDTLSTMESLATTYFRMGDYEKAKELEMVVLEKRSKVLGEEHPGTLRAMGTLATIHGRLGDFENARRLEVIVLEKRTTLLGQDHPDTLMAMGNLARTCSNLGDYEKGKELEIVVLEKRTKVLGEENPATLTAIGNLALTYCNLGDYEKARELEMVVLEKQTRVLGEEHPSTLLTMGNLAMSYEKLGNFEKARGLGMVVLERQTKVLGEEHPDTLLVMGNLALTYSNLGDYEKAKELEMVVLDKRTRVLGQEHPDTSMAMGNLALTYSSLGDYEKAKDLGMVVLERQTKVLGEEHPDTLTAMGNLALTYSNLGDYEKAKELEMVVLEKKIRVLGEDHPDTLQAMGNLAVTHLKLGDFEKAGVLGVTVLEKRSTLLGQDHPGTLIAMANLAATYHAQGAFTKAEALEIVVLEKQRQHFGDKHPDSIRAMRNLTQTYRKLQKLKEAEELEQLVKESQNLI
ncbi:hypothetical protein B0H16DRAFT_1894377 [Mycena metata]|uniref:TPR-like protein n=1 Tax=Mycena metata TaxID=1033252 RepID=A0AAD7HUH9_9AGAR|nr:hypothetical protein B0H16DRAFT_1894377 [Mycena metata]